jgi:hypothetical protein
MTTTRTAAEQLASAIERFIEAKLLNTKLRNPESETALGAARSALVELLGERKP